VSGWPKGCGLARASLSKYSDKGLKLAQLRGVLPTWARLSGHFPMAIISSNVTCGGVFNRLLQSKYRFFHEVSVTSCTATHLPRRQHRRPEALVVLPLAQLRELQRERC
jgi:hypothetical protein